MNKPEATVETTLRGRGILITGGSSGIGKAVAKACVEAGADVTICARNQEAIENARAELKGLTTTGQRVLGATTNVADAAAVAQMVRTANEEMPNLTGLVNGAGMLGPKGDLEEATVEEWLATMQVNLMGTMLTCRSVLPHFRARGYGKIVNFSGGGATSPRPRFSAYAASKAAVVRFTENLAHELEGSGIDANTVAPGAVNTRMLQEVLDAGPEKVGETAYREALQQKARGGTPAERAAALCVLLLAAASDGLTGRLISAVWDPWETLPERKEELKKSDVYTLRRIVPADRGLNWG